MSLVSARMLSGDALHWCRMFFRNLILLSIALSGGAQTMMNGRSSVVLGGKAAEVVVDLGGGSIVEFQLAGPAPQSADMDVGRARAGASHGTLSLPRPLGRAV